MSDHDLAMYGMFVMVQLPIIWPFIECHSMVRPAMGSPSMAWTAWIHTMVPGNASSWSIVLDHPNDMVLFVMMTLKSLQDMSMT